MKLIRIITLVLSVVGVLCLLSGGSAAAGKELVKPGEIKVYSVEKRDYFLSDKVIHSEDEWNKLLTAEQYHTLREQGTERAFTGKYWDNHEQGIYRCAGCGLDLYHSAAKYDSGTGWPSYYQPVAAENVSTRMDRGFFMTRNELICSRCDGHLGHIFDDGPDPSGKRHCVNSESLIFHKLDE
ncbi:MAG: peptide-methionine (R)-S-oxide reductase MsrB [Desulfuromonadales bacterium]|nr:peptide-methionine (R)-S-oxide reductase MsrB [Desulfuromonadales bacterium]